MPTPYQTPIGSFTRKSTFFWAAVGATVGLANLWQFPYLASLHGGGLFILLYLGCLLLVTLPIMVTEATIGRYSRHGIVLALDGFVRSAKVSRAWVLAGRFSVIAAFLVLSFTAVFGAIALAYVFFGAMGRFTDVGDAEAGRILSGLVSDPKEYRLFMAWHALFLILVIWVSVQGVVKGLERTLRVVVPGMLLLMLGLFALSAWQGQVNSAVSQILAMHPEDFTFESVRVALFHAFFTLGLGMGVWTIFGAYTAVGTSLKRSLLAVVLIDTLVAILAGMMMFSVAASGGGLLDGERGFGLLFVSLPVTLGQLPASQFVIAAVFLMVVLIVWTTSLALMEPIVGWFREWTGAPRGWSALLVGAVVWFAGLGTLLSFNVWAGERLAGGTLFRWVELVTGGLLIPTVAILVSVFFGWKLTRSLSRRILGEGPGIFLVTWTWVMRLVVPVVVLFIGVQYMVSSLAHLCDSGSDGLWCGQPSVLTEIEGQRLDEPNASVQDAPPPQLPAGGEFDVPKHKSPQEPASDRRAPKKDEILYHSV
ncbi:sodium-dependent transporter [Marinobacter salinisoli]|uniref:Sodium-dependent transporter n=1 Tax=Marinobacter salinisoli TaxID=2769486 RepID=A0ABX7MS11_9GAMM|nr:sodium-dependent transporter [Marinobacter salinisoli]QSP95064.1 sodium-dependent transporter [Marinobacter salinisoli]